MAIGRYCMATRSYTAIWSSRREERLTVQNIFTTYLAGLSYQALADRMNAGQHPVLSGIAAVE